MKARSPLRHVFGLAVLLVWSCGGDTSTSSDVLVGPPPPAPTSDPGPVPVAEIIVTPDTVQIMMGTQVQLTAQPMDSAGQPLVGRLVTWASSNSAVASVDGAGLVAAVDTGSATISAQSEGQTGTAFVSVSPVPVAAVIVTPDTVQIDVGTQVQLTAQPVDSAGQPLAGRLVAWASSNAAVASVSGTGLVVAVDTGSATISAQSEGHTGAAFVSVSFPPQTLVGAGDIADCLTPDDERTALLLDQIEGTVFTLGDNAYEDGTVAEFANCYEPSWGRHKLRTFPSLGNHDYKAGGPQPYFDYFGANAGTSPQGYYSYDLGSWKIIVLDSNWTKVGVGPGSPQVNWLVNELSSDPRLCTLAYWHHPRFSSGFHGDNLELATLWETLVSFGAELVMAGHDHSYERFAAMDANGDADPVAGMRQIVAGTGGRFLRPIGIARSVSEVRNSDTFGVLKLTLRDGSYHWEFVPVAGQSFTDQGSEACH